MSDTIKLYYESKVSGTACELNGVMFVIVDGAHCLDEVGELFELAMHQPTGKFTYTNDDAMSRWCNLLAICSKRRPCVVRPINPPTEAGSPL